MRSKVQLRTPCKPAMMQSAVAGAAAAARKLVHSWGRRRGADSGKEQWRVACVQRGRGQRKCPKDQSAGAIGGSCVSKLSAGGADVQMCKALCDALDGK